VTSCRSIQNLLNCKTDFQTEDSKVAWYDENDTCVNVDDNDDDDDDDD